MEAMKNLKNFKLWVKINFQKYGDNISLQLAYL